MHAPEWCLKIGPIHRKDIDIEIENGNIEIWKYRNRRYGNIEIEDIEILMIQRVVSLHIKL